MSHVSRRNGNVACIVKRVWLQILLLVLLSLNLLDGPVQRLAGLYASDFSLAVLDPLSLLGTLLGGPSLGLAGAWLAVGRHLAEIQPE